jgi:hypothetical protein
LLNILVLNQRLILKLVPLGMYSNVYWEVSYFFCLSSGQDAFGKKEKAEETRWARRFVRICQ